MAKVTVVAKVTAKADAIDQVKCELLKMVEPTRLEQGCLEYRLHQDSRDPTVFLFYENWADAAALERHLGAPHYLRYVAAVADLIAEKIVHKMGEIA